jgi:hypothetical protein
MCRHLGCRCPAAAAAAEHPLVAPTAAAAAGVLTCALQGHQLLHRQCALPVGGGLAVLLLRRLQRQRQAVLSLPEPAAAAVPSPVPAGLQSAALQL